MHPEYLLRRKLSLAIHGGAYMVQAASSGDFATRLAFTREEAAKATSLSVRTIDSLIADRRSGFPFAKIGGRIVIPKQELQEWLRDTACRSSGFIGSDI